MLEKQTLATAIHDHKFALFLTLGFPLWGLIVAFFTFEPIQLDRIFAIFLLLPLGVLNFLIKPFNLGASGIFLASIGLLIGLIAEIVWKLGRRGSYIVIGAFLLNSCGMLYVYALILRD